MEFGAYYALPGSVHTVARAELSAMVTVAEMVEEGSTVEYIGDNENVVNTFHKGEDAAKASSNCDLYQLLFQYIKNRNLQFYVKWMPSHLATDPKKLEMKPSWVTQHDIDGNCQADRLAGIAARIAAVDLNAVLPVIKYTNLVKQSNIDYQQYYAICLRDPKSTELKGPECRNHRLRNALTRHSMHWYKWVPECDAHFVMLTLM